MITCHTIGQLRSAVAELRSAGKRIGFVPTMGNLHDGHMELVRVARGYADACVVSIFINPMQFGPNEDLAAYPRTPENDCEALIAQGVDVVFLPEVEVVYPRGTGDQTYVEVPVLSELLCGASRPGHFRGVATVVNRLFNLVGADVAVFGKKDYQQLKIIQRMVDDLGMPIDLVGVDTVREADGLALSSRNQYLTVEERQVAPKLYENLRLLAADLSKGVGIDRALEQGRQALGQAGFRVDYLELRRQIDLMPAKSGENELVLLVAAYLGRARLIDNLEVNLNPAR